MIGRRDLLAGAALLGAGLAARPARAQAYPNKPIKVMLGFPPGGPTDIVARLIAARMTEGLGQPVIVENRPGASGTLAMKTAVTADPDGYTLLFGGVATYVTSPLLIKNLDIDPRRQLAPVAVVSDSPMVLCVHPSMPARSVQELVTQAKANPGTLNFASTGVGSPPHLTGELFKTMSGANIVHVPYRGGAPSLNDVMAGQVQMIFQVLGVVRALIREGRLRPLAATSEARIPELPDVPTMIESGYPGFLSNNWTGLAAPAGVPAEVLSRLNAEVNKGLQSPELKERFAALGFETKGGPPADFARLLDEDIQRWSAVIKSAGVVSN